MRSQTANMYPRGHLGLSPPPSARWLQLCAKYTGKAGVASVLEATTIAVSTNKVFCIQIHSLTIAITHNKRFKKKNPTTTTQVCDPFPSQFSIMNANDWTAQMKHRFHSDLRLLASSHDICILYFSLIFERCALICLWGFFFFPCVMTFTLVLVIKSSLEKKS